METLGRYSLTEEIGRGGMAVVYGGFARGEHGFRKPVVVKRIHPHLTRRAPFVQMLVREAMLTVRLDHPNVVQVLELGRSGDDYFLVMERVDGCDLGQLLAAAAAAGVVIPAGLAAHVIREVLAALHHAHRARNEAGEPLGIVHRDVSPSNVMIGADGRVRITDFGVARTSLHQSQAGLKGKLAYMSPEQARGEIVGPACDLYAAGLVLVELLTGRRPLEAGGEIEILEAARTGALGRISRAELPDDLWPVIGRALAPDAAQRFADAERMRAALAPLALGVEQGQARLSELVKLLQPVREQSLGSDDLVTATPPERTQAVETVVTRVTAVQPGTHEGKPSRGGLWAGIVGLAVMVGLVVASQLLPAGTVGTRPPEPTAGEAEEEPEVVAPGPAVEPIRQDVEPAGTVSASSTVPAVVVEPGDVPDPPADVPDPLAVPATGTLSVMVSGATGEVTSDIPHWGVQHATVHRREVPAGTWTISVRNDELGLDWQGEVSVGEGEDVGLRLGQTDAGWESWVRTSEGT